MKALYYHTVLMLENLSARFNWMKLEDIFFKERKRVE